MRSLPPEVCLCRSSVPGAEFGVCTRRHIPAETWIGPFEGKRVQPADVKAGMDTSFMWEVSGHYSEITIVVTSVERITISSLTGLVGTAA